jgi:hypothetical protein
MRRPISFFIPGGTFSTTCITSKQTRPWEMEKRGWTPHSATAAIETPFVPVL